jgi:heme A synthase
VITPVLKNLLPRKLPPCRLPLAYCIVISALLLSAGVVMVVLIFFTGALVGALAGALACVRYVRQEMNRNPADRDRVAGRPEQAVQRTAA